MKGSDRPAEELEDAQRQLAAQLFNRTWELLDTVDRTGEQDDEMLAAAFGQRFHWYEVGAPLNRAIADWQVSRVAAVLGHADIASRFGVASLGICEAHELDPFYRAYAHEAIARAADVAGDTALRDQHILAARELLASITDEEQRRMVEADVEMFRPHE